MTTSLVQPTTLEMADNMMDITGASEVEIIVRHDQKVIWVNVNGACALRVCRIDRLSMEGCNNMPPKG